LTTDAGCVIIITMTEQTDNILLHLSSKGIFSLKVLVTQAIASGLGNETLMIASPHNPVEKVPKMLWYEEDGISNFDVIWEDRPKHPVKTMYEWAKELGIEMEVR
jgi:hypothetical protein